MKILTWYPIHRTWINSIAELFPDYTFDLAECSQIITATFEKAMWLTDIIPFVPNIKIVGKYGFVEHRNYDLIFSWQWVYERINAKERWDKPIILFIHNAGERAPRGFKGIVVYNTYLSAELAGTPDAPVYLGVRKEEVIGNWTGEIPKGYVGNFDLFVGRLPLFSFEEVRKLVRNGLIEEMHGQLKWNDWMTHRRKLRFYLEILKRANCNAFLEAMRMGQPCIVPDTRDFNRFIQHGENGFLYKKPEEIEGIVKELCLNYDLAKEIGRKAKISIEKEINDEKRKKLLEKVFKMALEG